MKHHKARNIASVLLLSLADFAAAQDAITTKCNMMRDADSLSMQRMEIPLSFIYNHPAYKLCHSHSRGKPQLGLSPAAMEF